MLHRASSLTAITTGNSAAQHSDSTAQRYSAEQRAQQQTDEEGAQ